jgi:ribosomal protein L37AE/L43A
METKICSNSKQELLAFGLWNCLECTCTFTDDNGILKLCNRPFTDHRDDQTQPQGIF